MQVLDNKTSETIQNVKKSKMYVRVIKIKIKV